MAYLRAGNRVFDFKLNCTYDNSNKVVWELKRMTSNSGEATFTFDGMIKGAQAWLYEHPTECVICTISDYDTEVTHTSDLGYYTSTTVGKDGNTYLNGDYKVDLVTRTDYKNGNSVTPYEADIKRFIEDEKNTPPDLLLKSYDADLTLGEARGKIVIIDLSPYPDAVGLTVNSFKVNTKPSTSSWYQETRTIENEVDLSEHTFGHGKMYIQDFLNLQRRNGTGTSATIKSGADGGSYQKDINTKKTYLTNAFNKALGDNDHNNWYLICTACRGWANSPYRKNLFFETVVVPNSTTIKETAGNQKGYDMRNYVKGIANGASSGGTYQRLGMVLNAFAGTETYDKDKTGTNRTLEQIIWENNYKGNGPLKKTTE